MGIPDVAPESLRGLRLILIGMTILLLSYKYDRYLQTNKCPHCKADVPDEADICPSCYRSQFQYEGITCGQTLSVAFTLFLLMVVAVVAFVPLEPS